MDNHSVSKAASEDVDNGADDSDEDKAEGQDPNGVAAPGGKSSRVICTRAALMVHLVAKKKKKRKPKKKKGAAGGSKVQSTPPRVRVATLFPGDNYPEGEIVSYKDGNSFRTTNEEKRMLDRMNNDFLTDYRHGAEVHRQVRQWAQRSIKPGQTLTEIAENIEDSVRALTGHPGLEEGDNIKGGMGFPTGLSINHCAAHYTPNAGNKTILQKQDVMKVDFGVHINGRIVDSAWTMTFDPVYDNLLAAVKDATNAGVRVSHLIRKTTSIAYQICRKQVLMFACVMLELLYKKPWKATKSRLKGRLYP